VTSDFSLWSVHIGGGFQNLKITLNVGWSEDLMKTTPIFVNKILDNTEVPSLTQLDKKDVDAKLQHASMEECGHPSPVSILESPFPDESPTTSEESISGTSCKEPSPIKKFSLQMAAGPKIGLLCVFRALVSFCFGSFLEETYLVTSNECVACKPPT